MPTYRAHYSSHLGACNNSVRVLVKPEVRIIISGAVGQFFMDPVREAAKKIYIFLAARPLRPYSPPLDFSGQKLSRKPDTVLKLNPDPDPAECRDLKI